MLSPFLEVLDREFVERRGVLDDAAAAWAGLLFGFFGFWGFLLGILPGALLFGFEPIVPLFVGQIILVEIVPYFASQPPAERVEAYFDLFDGVW